MYKVNLYTQTTTDSITVGGVIEMNVKKAIKRIAALGAGAVLVGATILGAVAAADLGTYPAPFIAQEDLASVYNAKIVVGASAATMDVLGAADLASNLQTLSYVEEEIAGTGTIIVSGGESEDINLGTDLSAQWGTALTDSKISGLLDDKIRWNSEDLDFDESINVNGLAVLVTSDDEEFGADVYLGTDVTPEDFTYLLTIDDTDFNASAVDDTSSLRLDVDLLGKSLKITDIDVAGAQVTFKFAEDFTLSTGEEVTVDGSVIKVNTIGETSVAITVDGETEIITTDYDFGDLTVEVDSILYLGDSPADSIVKISVGSDITKAVEDGDAMEFFGYGDDNGDAEWVWSIVATDDDTVAIGAKYNQESDDLDEDFPPKAIGEKFILPNNYGAVYIAELTAEANREYTIEFKDSIDLDDADTAGNTTDYNDAKALMLSVTDGGDDDGFLVGTAESDTVYILYDGTDGMLLTYVDEDGDVIGVEEEVSNGSTEFATVLKIVNDDEIYTLTLNVTGTDEDVVITMDDLLDADEDITFAAFDLDTGAIGTIEDAETTDVSGTVAFGAYDYQYVTESGIIFGSDNGVESDLDDDEIIFTVPEELVQATVVIEGPETTVGGSVSTVKTMVPIVPSSVLDTDIEVGANNLIVIGGPCANSIAFELMGSPAACTDGFSQGKGLIKMWETGEYMAVLVAGYDAADTSEAVTQLINYEANAAVFAGTDEVEIATATQTVTLVEPIVPPAGNNT